MLKKARKMFHKIRTSNNPVLKSVVATKDLIWKLTKHNSVSSLSSPFEVFLSAGALAINKARMEHLGSLGLDLENKTVLEVGAGIGLLTEFFESRGCKIMSTDSRKENIQEIKRRFPHRNIALLDLEKEFDEKTLGTFDVVFCYGTLYHLSDPRKAIRSMARGCKELLLMETAVYPETGIAINQVDEKHGFFIQASSGIGCRPTRQFVLDELKKNMGYAYVTKLQPDYKDFKLDWTTHLPHTTYRSVFVGSRVPLNLETLLENPPLKQERFRQ